MNRFIPAVVLCLLVLRAAAQTEVDGMSLSGLAVYEQLRTDFYIGALYLPEPAKTANDAFFMPGRKRMDIRVIAESWSTRRFVQQWNQLILINNSPDEQKAHSDNIIAFASMLKDDLKAGDHMTIDHLPEEGTRVQLNGTTLMQVDDPAFFNLLLSCWIGARPPSSGFKQDLLQMPTGDAASTLLTSFEITAPTQARIAETKSWGRKVSVAAANKPQPEPKPAVAESAPKPDAEEAKRLAEERARREAEAAERARLAKLEAERLRKQAIARALAEAEAKAKAEARSKALINDYSSTMVRASYSHVRYPKRALKLNQEGTVLLEVIIKRDGKLVSSKVIQSSGYSALDEAAVSAVEKTAPFPVIPEGIPGNQIEFTLPFTFQISG